MISKVQAALAVMLPPGEPLLAGVSGGPDSVALLHALVKLGWRPHVCHLNHQLRGAESDADAEFVRQLAARYPLPCSIESRPVGRDENAARRARHEFFAEIARRTGITTLALGHTADDQAETFLLRLLRGAGAAGLGGIRPDRRIGPLRVIRPLLGIRRGEILEYLAAEKLAWREDNSNRDPRFTRNRIRHELLPLLEREYNPSVREALLRTAEILRDEEAFLDDQARAAVGMGGALSATALAKLPVAIQRRALRCWLGGEDETGGSPGFDHVEAVRLLALTGPAHGSVDLPGDQIVYREGDRLKKSSRAGLVPLRDVWQLATDGRTVIPGLGWTFLSHPEPSPTSPESDRGILEGFPEKTRPARRNRFIEECFDADALGDRPLIRTWQEGDRFQPLGMTGEKKLQDFFVDEKVPRRQRAHLPLLCGADGRIAWVVGHRMAESFKVTTRTRRVLRVRAVAAIRQSTAK